MRFQYSLIVHISLIDKYLNLIFGMEIGMNERNKAHYWIRSKNFFKILPNEKGQWVDENNNGLYQIFLFRTN